MSSAITFTVYDQVILALAREPADRVQKIGML
jgi:hypothetical protein